MSPQHMSGDGFYNGQAVNQSMNESNGARAMRFQNNVKQVKNNDA